MGPNDRATKTPDRPSFFKRLVGPAPVDGPSRPPAPMPRMPGVDPAMPDPDLLPPGTGATKPAAKPAAPVNGATPEPTKPSP